MREEAAVFGYALSCASRSWAMVVAHAFLAIASAFGRSVGLAETAANTGFLSDFLGDLSTSSDARTLVLTIRDAAFYQHS
jgi:hypothetical protein